MAEISQQTALIVDDSAPYAGVLRRILEAGLGLKGVMHCGDLAEAEVLIRADPGRFSLLFVDFRFPTGGTGVELLEKLHDVIPSSTVKFLITSEPSPENVKRALAAGAVGVVAKPFDRAALGLQLERAFKPLGGEA